MLEDVNLEFMSYTATIFILFIFLLNMVLYKPLISFMEKRDKVISDYDEFAKNNLDSLSEYDNEAESVLDEAKAKAYKIRQELLEKYKLKYEDAMANEKEKLEKDYVSFLSKLESDKVELETKLMLELDSYKQNFRDFIQKV